MEDQEPNISSIPYDLKVELLSWLGNPCSIANYAILYTGMRDVVHSKSVLDNISSTYHLPRSTSLQLLCDITREAELPATMSRAAV
jgi:hypothetical protein